MRMSILLSCGNTGGNMDLPHSEVCDVPFKALDMFNLVADVESYPAFLPWCKGAHILSQEPNPDNPDEVIILADLQVGYSFFSETFRSKVFLNQIKGEIRTEYVSGPFKFLRNRWLFEDISLTETEPRTKVHFFIDFSFKNPLLQKVMGAFFERAFLKMFQAFEQRAFDLYKNHR